MTDKVERVARALHDEWHGVGGWDSCGDAVRNRWKFMACAAIAEIEKPKERVPLYTKDGVTYWSDGLCSQEKPREWKIDFSLTPASA